MALIFRWLMRISSVLVLFAVALFLLAYYFASRSLPDFNAETTVAGISAPVEIVRDNSNVPHIFGASDEDVFFGMGYAHAQDRLWQMTLLRRTVQGRLSELFGERTVWIDTLLRRFDLYNLAVSSVEAQDVETLAALEAYSAGVNAWLSEVNKGALGRGAPEMWLFNHPIAPWQPADSIAIIKLMALDLNGQISSEVMRARTSLLLPNERVQDILPDAPGEGIAALPKYAELVRDVPKYAANTRQPEDPLAPISNFALAGASNAFVAGPSRSATGSTILANDPHLKLTAPSVWYLARMEIETGGVIGATIPGVPFILTGRSTNVGWGITSAYVDDLDVYLEEMNPDNPNQYRTPEGWKDFERRESIITIKDAPALTVDLIWTDNGPVLPADQYDLGTIRPAWHVTSVNWTALDPKDTSLTAAYGIMKSRNIQGAIDAAKDYVAPAMNLMLADRNNIAMQVMGAMPERDPAHQSKGRMPSYGYLTENRWKGVFTYDVNPSFVDPEGGIIGNTNNKTIDREFPYHVSYAWGDTQRINRWRRLMQSREVHTRESFIEAQLDTVSFTARALLPLIGADLWYTGEASPEGSIERKRQEALELLAEWNGEMNEHQPEPLIYAAWVRELQDRLIRDDLGPLADEFTHVEPLFIERVYRDISGASVWCDVVQSAPIETCTDIARAALDDAIVWISETYGPDLQSLRWGDAHMATQDHTVLGTTRVLNWFVNIRQSTSGGDNTMMRGRTRGTGNQPFQNVHAAGYRGVYDFADPDSSVFVISTGQSGHPLSRYYDDQGELWRRGEYIPMSLDPALARAAAVGITYLQPAQPE